MVGIPLSFAWRIGGNLVLPAAAHALIAHPGTASPQPCSALTTN
jgi:hypothetical protein